MRVIKSYCTPLVIKNASLSGMVQIRNCGFTLLWLHHGLPFTDQHQVCLYGLYFCTSRTVDRGLILDSDRLASHNNLSGTA